jgi:hypothetical protein
MGGTPAMDGMNLNEMSNNDLLTSFQAVCLDRQHYDEFVANALRDELSRRLEIAEEVSTNYRHPLLKDIRKDAEDTLR